MFCYFFRFSLDFTYFKFQMYILGLFYHSIKNTYHFSNDLTRFWQVV